VHPAFIFIGAIVLILGRKDQFKRFTIKILLASALLYSFFLAGIPHQNLRFLVLSFPLVLVFLFPSVKALFEKISLKSKSWILIAISAVQLILFVRAFIPFYHYNLIEKEIASEIKKYYEAPAIYTFEMDGALNSYGVKNKIVGLWNEGIDSIPSHSLLLFNESKFSKQWSGMNVMKNVSHIQEKKIIPLKSFQDGWQLSEIE
jgi:hypothetical protein